MHVVAFKFRSDIFEVLCSPLIEFVLSATCTENVFIFMLNDIRSNSCYNPTVRIAIYSFPISILIRIDRLDVWKSASNISNSSSQFWSCEWLAIQAICIDNLIIDLWDAANESVFFSPVFIVFSVHFDIQCCLFDIACLYHNLSLMHTVRCECVQLHSLHAVQQLKVDASFVFYILCKLSTISPHLWRL